MLGILNSRDIATAFSSAGESQGYAISPNGVPAGGSGFCRGPGAFDNCAGYVPVINAPFTMVGPTNPQVSDNGYAYAVNSNGVAVGVFDEAAFGQGSTGAIFSAGGFTRVNFIPRAILDDGTVYGNKYFSGGVVKRSVDGTVKDLNCGSIMHSANSKGDVVTNCGLELCIYHEEECFKLRDVLPAGFKAFQTPTRNSGPSVNDLGRVATMAVPSGQSVANNANYVGIFFTPEFPLSVSVSATATGVPGEHIFEAKLLVGNNPSGNVNWEFIDSSGGVTSETSFGTGKLTKKFTKPGKYTAKAKVTNSTNQVKTGSIEVTILPPSLTLSITVPSHPEKEIQNNSDANIVVQAIAANDGVGELKDLTFQGGIFTVDTSEPLSFTTAATSPFSISPGSASTFPVNVRAVNEGEVKVRSLLIGKDAAGAPVSASADITIKVSEGITVTSSPNLKLTVGRPDSNNNLPVTIKNRSKKESFTILVSIRVASVSTATLLSTEKKLSLKKNATKDIKVRPNKSVLDRIKAGETVAGFLLAKSIDGTQKVLSINSKAVTFKGKKKAK